LEAKVWRIFGTWFILIGSLLAMDCRLVLGQTKVASVKIGTHEISVGMPADRTIAALREDFKVEPLPDTPPLSFADRHWMVLNKKDLAFLAFIYTNGNTVVAFEHQLFERDLKSGQDIFNALFETSSKLSREARNTCVVTTWTDYKTTLGLGLSKAEIIFNCGAYRIRLQRTEFDGHTAFMVYEMVLEELGTNR